MSNGRNNTVIKPILFNTDMVRAILEGRKTVTRRVVKPLPELDADGRRHELILVDKKGMFAWKEHPNVKVWAKPPYQPGDLLYMRETWRIQVAHRFEADARIEFKAGGPMSTIPEFWCGVFATLFVEVCLVILIGVYQGRKRKQKEASADWNMRERTATAAESDLKNYTTRRD